MTDFERINAPRVEKIMAMIATIAKSAKSNRVPHDEVAALLAPVRLAVTPIPTRNGMPIGTDPVVRKVDVTVTQPSWATVREMAQEASLADLTYAMAVYLNRIDEELHK